ncbi:MAG TPA: gephyrin-like molybdotransferase Glp [Candidatus Binataceae bacterium]|nr:gephyrin-like molybdotransferase Glp [Candidatus Binataceae bacterium]
MPISADQALQTILDNVAPLGIERVSIRDARGRVLAQEIRSSRDIPGFDNSAMDGYAVRSADIASASAQSPVKLEVLETVAAGSMPAREVSRGTATRIMTGAPLPSGADAVIPVEQTRERDGMVEILLSAPGGFSIRSRGEDLRRDEVVIKSGRLLTPADIGLLASLNRAIIEVYRRPRVAILAGGDEIVEIDQVPSGAQVVDSNGYALAAAVAESGAEPTMLKISRDRIEVVRERLSDAMTFDAVLSTGGVSVGQFDLVEKVFDELGMRRLFHGVAQKPGRPMMFGLIGTHPIFALPGNPVSTVVCFYLYVRSALLRMAARRDLSLPRIKVRCAVDIKTAQNLTEFVRVKLERREGEVYAAPTGAQGSGILSSLSRADGLLIGPSTESLLKAGSQATVLLLTGAAVEEEVGFEERLRLQ